MTQCLTAVACVLIRMPQDRKNEVKEKYKMKNILLMGATGTAGSAITKKLLSDTDFISLCLPVMPKICIRTVTV